MPIDRHRAKHYLKGFDFRPLFVEELGWDKYTATLPISVGGTVVALKGVVEKRGVVVLVCEEIPDYTSRLKIEKQVAKSHFEHFIIFTDKAQGRQLWQWARREPGRPIRVREHRYETSQSGELLIQKLENVLVTLDQEESFTLSSVTHGLKAAFDVETVTKKFYERFKAEHEQFLKFIEGIPDKHMESWYASVMMNRLMFLYFIQAKTFLDGNVDYLRAKLAESKGLGPNRYYREFLGALFFEGFARRKDERAAAINKLIGNVPYLNGGLFQKHQIEELHSKKIQIPDRAFDRLFDFFKDYQWHLDERPDRDDREINPDVLGYIFEKYINQKQMGAYYTKEDITEYISKNAIIPFLFASAKKRCAVAFHSDGYVWRLVRENPDRYIFEALRRGNECVLPTEISAGSHDIGKRQKWNQSTPFEKQPESFLPTETWREFIERRQRYREVRQKLTSGQIVSVSDFVTLNIDIRQFAEDVIQYSEGPELVRAFYKAISTVSVLDPTCGSGAFLFAALNILKPLYEACLKRMDAFVEELDTSAGKASPEKFKDFREVLAECRKHPNQDYFVLKSIIVNNLYGVDIMEEAIEICKLRLFLKLVAQVDSQDRIEPLPDIDFNIIAGNTLVGYARYADVEKSVGSKLDFGGAMEKIEDKARILDSSVEIFRQQQTRLNGIVTADDKKELRRRFRELAEELDDFLAGEYNKNTKKDVTAWRESHRPLHWFSEFHEIMNKGGFDVVIGNPPYIEMSEIKEYSVHGYRTADCGNIYAPCVERFSELLCRSGSLGVIVPLSGFSTDRMGAYQDLVAERYANLHISYYSGDAHPSVMFSGVKYRLCIILGNGTEKPNQIYTSPYLRWYADERPTLFQLIRYSASKFSAGFLRFAKSGCVPADRILERMTSKQGRTVGSLLIKNGPGLINYHRSPVFWIRSMDFEPYFHSATRTRSLDHLKDLILPSQKEARAIGAVINSTCFYFWFSVQGNCRNIAGPDIESFPIGKLDTETLDELEGAFKKLMKDLQRHSKRRVYNYERSGRVEYDEFYPSKSKPFIDEIDRILGRHYGFSPEEVDFLINYDGKYRMGRDAGDE